MYRKLTNRMILGKQDEKNALEELEECKGDSQSQAGEPEVNNLSINSSPTELCRKSCLKNLTDISNYELSKYKSTQSEQQAVKKAIKLCLELRIPLTNHQNNFLQSVRNKTSLQNFKLNVPAENLEKIYKRKNEKRKVKFKLKDQSAIIQREVYQISDSLEEVTTSNQWMLGSHLAQALSLKFSTSIREVSLLWGNY